MTSRLDELDKLIKRDDRLQFLRGQQKAVLDFAIWACREFGPTNRTRAKVLAKLHEMGLRGKLCGTCNKGRGEWHALIDFSRCKRNKDGLCHRCRDCDRRMKLEWRNSVSPEHKEKLRQSWRLAAQKRREANNGATIS